MNTSNRGNRENFLPRLIAWEVTRSCNLKCRHCRAAAQDRKYSNELTTEQSFRLLDNIAGFASPIVILTGGEPMLREDIYQIARHGHELGLRMVMAPCGALIDETAVDKMHVVQTGRYRHEQRLCSQKLTFLLQRQAFLLCELPFPRPTL